MKRRTILVVDDNLINRQLLKEALCNEFDIIEAVDGKQAIGFLEELHTTVSTVLLDIAMPELDGYEVLRRMRENPKLSQIPVIMVTGIDDEPSRIKALSLGANDFITKPFSLEIVRHCIKNSIALHETSAEISSLQRDTLTGLYTREVFLNKVSELVLSREAGHYIMACFDIDRFKVINDQYGTKKGDEILRYLGAVFKTGFAAVGGICCRIAADDFAILYPASFKDTPEMLEISRKASNVEGLLSPLVFSTGRYLVDDPTLSASAMFDRAMLAAETVKSRFEGKIAYYSESMRNHLILEQEIVMEMESALRDRQFEVWYQPQFNHATGAQIGAEALVRWRHPKKGLIWPNLFIPIFEQNGFIYSLDRYIWEEVCRFLKKRLDEGETPPPISVNISRYDALQPNIVESIKGLVAKYNLPVNLLRLEITESAFAEATKVIVRVARQLIDSGFTLEIDDFGSGYSSLNTLKDVPAQVLKLDMRFFEESDDSQRSGSIIESIVRMAKWLGMSVISEGVENKEQADFLKSIGSLYVQGYYYAKPMPQTEYEDLSRSGAFEPLLNRLETIDGLNNNVFWDPKSMETLIFNSYVGGACIFEYHNGKTEIIRSNDEYAKIFSGNFAYDFSSISGDSLAFLDEQDKRTLMDNIKKSIETRTPSSCEVRLSDERGHYKNLRPTVRVIAQTGDRYLLYCVLADITDHRGSDKRKDSLTERAAFSLLNIDYEFVFTINAETGEITPLFGEVSGEMNRMEGKDWLSEYLINNCASEDKERALRETSLDYIKATLKMSRVHTVFYTFSQAGRPVHRRSVYSYLDLEKKVILCGMQNIEKTIIEA